MNAVVSVASFASASAAAAPTIALAAEPDPIFAAIEDFRRAEAEWLRAEESAERLSPPYNVPSIPLYPKCEMISSNETEGEWEVFRIKTGAPTGEYYRGGSAEDIERSSTTIPKEHRAHWIADRRAALAREKARLRRELSQSGYTAAEGRVRKLGEVQERAGWTMAETAPTTAAGASALLGEALHAARGCVLLPEMWMFAAIETVRDALQAQAEVLP